MDGRPGQPVRRRSKTTRTAIGRAATRQERALVAGAMRKWRITGYLLPHSVAQRAGAKPEDFDRDQLAIGTQIELEHAARYPDLALEIAMSHLVERPDYYALLERMEKIPVTRPKGRQ